MSGYYFLTGATGLLGNYILRDLLRAGRQVAVLVRPNRRMTARQRIENLLARWDAEQTEPLARPVILEGDITQPDLGLDGSDLRWAAEHCHAIIHNAASLNFEASNAEAEPYRSNVQGTQSILEFARQAGIREFHHVSTAYVAGLRSGQILETDVDVGQKLGNDYETSKLTAEKLVRNADFIDPPTVFRPGIIIGDSKTGFTTTYHGFYAALQLTHTIVQAHDRDENGAILGEPVRLNLSGDETKHLVPVDWVSAAMVHVLLHRELHGQTYHLTPRTPVTTRVIRDVLEEAISLRAAELCGADYVPDDINETESLFREHIRVYNSYWRMDPDFDSRNIQAAAPHLLCPDVDFDLLLRLSRQAIAEGFPTPGKKPISLEHDAETILQPWVSDTRSHEGRRVLGLDVRGPGGGQWQLLTDHGQLVAVEMGLHADCPQVCQTDVRTFSQVTQGQDNWASAFSSGKARLVGVGMSSREGAALLDQLVGVPVGQ